MTSFIPENLTRPANRFFGDDLFHSFFFPGEATTFRVDVRDEGDVCILEADLPGVKREQVHVDVEEGVLTIRCDAVQEPETRYLLHERLRGSFSRSFTLSEVDPEHITASFEQGVLTLRLPKKQQAASARRIEIR